MSWQEFLAGQTPEYIGTVLAVVSVICIARQKMLGWPLGILWAAISAWLAFTRWHLFSDSVLYISYIPLQLYCWWTWWRKGTTQQLFRPTWLKPRQQMALVASVILAVMLWGQGVKFLAHDLHWIAPPALLWRDATTTVLNYFAQVLQAQKRMENWVGWLLVNVLGIHIYSTQGSYVYAAQYGFFLLLGLYGAWAWYRAMKEDAA